MAEGFRAEAGGRHLDGDSEFARWLTSHELLNMLARDLGRSTMRLVRIIAFDKTDGANWFVPWHQDRTIAVAVRAEVPGFDNWTFKDGCHHVEPPEALLASMLTLRVHLDRCGAHNGALEVLPGSHSAGRLNGAAIADQVAGRSGVSCIVEVGGVLAMRPLIVHRSKRAAASGHRRVLHLEYAGCGLPPPLTWAIDGAPSPDARHQRAVRS